MDLMETSQPNSQRFSQMDVDGMEMDFEDFDFESNGGQNARNAAPSRFSAPTLAPEPAGAGGHYAQPPLGSPMEALSQGTPMLTQSPFDGAQAPPLVPLYGFQPSAKHHSLEVQSLRHVAETSLGSGSFGNVTVGVITDASGRSQEVAIKHAQALSRTEACRAMKKEMAVFERIPPHKNIVEYLGGKVGEPGKERADGKDFFIVEELLPGNLSSLIHSNAPFAQRCTYRDLLEIFHGIVAGLQHLHSHNVIHHDLKPSNVLVSKDLDPKLADFGASAIRLRRSITATIRGTPGYIAPEAYYGGLVKQISGGKIRVNESIDVFSLGAMMWECIMRSPVGGPDNSQQDDEATQSQTDTETGACIKWGGLTKVRCDCPKSLRDLVEECLRFDHDNIETMDFRRPMCDDLKSRLAAMLLEDWVEERPPWPEC
ncbi:hypothetical protein BSKO_11152 [Bryopsis sp. KO-2023]|nr:hypothetical protein BSKO_11152 [Bryopsis sp. KO-2023]